MLSQGLGPRQSVLPLLISFLFSHIVLAKHSLPLRRSPHILLLPPFFSFLHSFRCSSFSPVSPSYLSSWSLFISRPMPYLAPWESARAIRAARKEVLILAKTLLSFRVFAIDPRDDVTSSTLVDLIELCITILPVKSVWRESDRRIRELQEILLLLIITYCWRNNWSIIQSFNKKILNDWENNNNQWNSL